MLKSDPGARECCGGLEGFNGSAVGCAEAAEVFEALEAAYRSRSSLRGYFRWHRGGLTATAPMPSTLATISAEAADRLLRA